LLVTRLMEACHLDDPVQAVAVHVGGGACASIGSALFANPVLVQRVYGLAQVPTEFGLFLGGGWKHLACSVIGTLSVFSFTSACTLVVLGLLYCIDRTFSLHWFFMRSSYETEQVTFMEDAGEKGHIGLGIADVTKQNMEVEMERDHIIMFVETPRSLRGTASEPLEGRLKKVERARKRFEKLRRKQMKQSRPSSSPAAPPPPPPQEQLQGQNNVVGEGSPDYDIKEITPSFEMMAVEL
jgi:hypothetical protein